MQRKKHVISSTETYERSDDSQRCCPSSLLPPPLSEGEAGSQGAGAALAVNGLRLRHVTQQQLPINNTASPGKWWQGFGSTQTETEG